MTSPWRLISQQWQNTHASEHSCSTGSTPMKKSKNTRRKLHKHRLRVQALQPGPPRPETDSAQSAEFLGHVSAKRAAETGRASFCRWWRSRARIRGFSFPLNFFCRLNNGRQTRQNLLQPSGLLERYISHQKIGRSCESS